MEAPREPERLSRHTNAFARITQQAKKAEHARKKRSKTAIKKKDET